MTRLLLVAASAQYALGNPLAKVLQLMDDLSTKITAEGEAEAKAYKEFVDWCKDTTQNAGFEIKTATSTKEKLEASIEKLTSDISASTSKVADLADSIAASEAELKDATGVREKENADFASAEAELVDGVDTLSRAIGIIEREMAKSGAFTQLDVSSMSKLTGAIGAVLDAAADTTLDKNKLMAFVQSQNDDDDSDTGAPAPAAYASQSGGIVELLTDMKEKAEGELAELRKVEGKAQQAFNLLKSSLERKVAADNKDLSDEKNSIQENTQGKATASGDLEIANKDLSTSTDNLNIATSDCLTSAADHQATVAARAEELGVIAQAKKILEDTSSGAVSQSYGFLQISSRTELVNSEVVAAVKNLAVEHHSAALNQLASRISTVMTYGGGDVFAKIKGLISDMIAKLESEGEADATEKAYCDEEMAKTEAKKAELEDDLASLTGKIDQAASSSALLKRQVAAAQEELANIARSQAEMDEIRRAENAEYNQAKSDLQAGLGGVQKALSVLREYYGGAALVQAEQPAVPEHKKASGAGQSIIGILEVCESDFSKDLAKEEAAEADSAANYEKTTQENKITTSLRQQDVKYKTQEFKSQDKEINELSSDKATLSTEYSAVLEYYKQIKDRCVAKPESYEERAKRRSAEIQGLKDALQILENETAFVQRKKHFLGHLRP